MIPGIGFIRFGTMGTVRPLMPSRLQVWVTEPGADRIYLTAAEARQLAQELLTSADDLDDVNRFAEDQDRLWHEHEAEHDRRERRNASRQAERLAVQPVGGRVR